MKKILIIIITILMLLPINLNAEEKKILNIYLFYGDTCPHCKDEKEFFNEYLKDKPNIKLHLFEIWRDGGNAKKLVKVKEILDDKSSGVPYLVIGEEVIVGFNGSFTEENIKDKIDFYLDYEFKDEVGIYLGIVDEDGRIIDSNKDKSSKFTVPILGKVDAKEVSLPLLAIVIGLVDGFNPCAMWILLFLITMLLGLKDKKKMWILGFTFLLSSGIVYLLFMASWLSLASFINKVTFIKIAIGLIALTFGALNIRKYIKSRKDDVGCEVVDDKKRKKIMKSVKKVTSQKYFILSILGIIALAASVNVIELVCSLGLPVIFTQILSFNNLSSFENLTYMLLYMVFFLIDDIIVFIIAMKTLEIKAVSNKFTKYSHLIGGAVMLLIGLLMIFKPEWLMFNF